MKLLFFKTLISVITFPNLAFSQVVSDDTVSTTVNEVNPNYFEITDGEQVGENLFHSFRELSVAEAGAIAFLNANIIDNIITRVTGDSPSEIEGLIKAQGNANLIILNPHGIHFGEEASLEIGGSFMATTAEAIEFADGTVYSATNPKKDSLLTVSTPIGLGFGKTPGNITNRAGTIDELQNNLPVGGLEVPLGETIALVGGNISFQEGILRTQGGRVELGAVAGESNVGFTATEQGWELNYEGVDDFANIELFSNSILTLRVSEEEPEFETASSAQLQGKQILFDNNSDLTAINQDRRSSEAFFIRARDSLVLKDRSSIINTSLKAAGAGGDIMIETANLELLDSSRINANTQRGKGNAGNIVINTQDATLDNLSVISTETFGDGEAGDITLNTEQLLMTQGSRIVSSLRQPSSGDGGKVTINATDSITVEGNAVNIFSGATQFSQIASEARTSNPALADRLPTTGDAGRVNIKTRDLQLRDGGGISVAIRNQAQGKAGELRVDADRLMISGEESGVFADSVSSQDAGNLIVNSQSLLVEQGGQIAATATGTGNAGNVVINSEFINLQQGQISADTVAGEGNISISAQEMRLRDNSTIQTNAFGFADGGNITIDASAIALLENSNIQANAQQGFGGRVSITTEGLFQSQNSRITATSERGEEFSGLVEITSSQEGNLETFITEFDQFSLSQVYEECGLNEEASRFIVSGRGGKVTPPAEDYHSSLVGEDLALPTQVIEAEGWVTNEQGQTVLTARQPFQFQSLCLIINENL